MSVISGKTNSGLVAYARAQLGLPYWYGTFGQIATQKLLDSKAKQYKSTGYYTKWTDYPQQFGKRVHDCVGLIKGYLWSASATAKPAFNSAQDKSAQGMYAAATEKGTINSFPARPGQLVFMSKSKSDAKKIHHAGVYIGDGYVIEAKGHEYGVVKTVFAGAGWTHWAQCPYITDDNANANAGKSYTKSYAGSYTVTGRTVYIRDGAGTTSKALGILKKSETVKCEGYFKRINGTVWLEVTATVAGKTVKGYVSEKHLEIVK